MRITVAILFSPEEDGEIPDQEKSDFADEVESKIADSIRYWGHIGALEDVEITVAVLAVDISDISPPPKSHPGMGNDGPDDETIAKN